VGGDAGRGMPWSLDVWLLGCLIYELYNGAFTRIDQVKSKGRIPESLFGCVAGRWVPIRTHTHVHRHTSLPLAAALLRQLTAWHRLYKDMLKGDPKLRPAPSQLLERAAVRGGYLAHEMVLANQFVETFALKDAYERDLFFRKLTDAVDAYPPAMLKNRMLPELLQALEFGSGVARHLGIVQTRERSAG
jgi:SCY1-like protein 1